MQFTEVDDTNVLLCEFIPVLYLCLFILNKNKYLYLFRLVERKSQEMKGVTLRWEGWGVLTGPRDFSSGASDLFQQLHKFS
jgi:hypothetical protein